MSRTELRELWEERVANFQASGQTATAWCSEQGLNLHTLRYWIQKVGAPNKVDAAAPVKWLSVEIAGANVHQPAVSEGRIVVCIGNTRVEVEPGCDLILLREVVQTLAALC